MSIGLVIVDTYKEKRLARHALERSLAWGLIKSVYTFSEEPILSGERFYRINAISSAKEYSDLLLTVLPFVLQESHCLVVQWDGYVRDPALWDDAFLEYDYVGAPWRGVPENRAVGNGGFSLRSAKLVSLVAKYRHILDTELPESNAEDVLVSRYLRPALEASGMSFPSVEVADCFSSEDFPIPRSSFGFHGVGALAYFEEEQWLIENLPDIFTRTSRDDFLVKFILSAASQNKLGLVSCCMQHMASHQDRYRAVLGWLTKRNVKA